MIILIYFQAGIIGTVTESLQNIFVEWLKASRLHLNISKIVFVNFTPRTNAINTTQFTVIYTSRSQ